MNQLLLLFVCTTITCIWFQFRICYVNQSGPKFATILLLLHPAYKNYNHAQISRYEYFFPFVTRSHVVFQAGHKLIQ